MYCNIKAPFICIIKYKCRIRPHNYPLKSYLSGGAFSSRSINSLPSDKIFDKSKLKGFVDDKIKVTQKLKFVLGRVENIVGEGENAGYQW